MAAPLPAFALVLTLSLPGVSTDMEVVDGVVSEAECIASGNEFVSEAVAPEVRTFVCVEQTKRK